MPDKAACADDKHGYFINEDRMGQKLLLCHVCGETWVWATRDDGHGVMEEGWHQVSFHRED